MTRITIVTGSNRARSQSERIGRIAEGMLAEIGAETDLLSLHAVEIPMWSEEKWAEDASPESFWRAEWPAISARLAAADGFVVVSPEWHGMASPMLKNLLCCCDKGELAFKPAHPIAVSAGAGGAYPISELRQSGYKNSYLHWTPDHTIVRDAAAFQPGAPEHEFEWLATRMRASLRILVALAAAAAPVRAEVVDLATLRNGM